MKRVKFLLSATAFTLAFKGAALGADVSSHGMTFDFQPINEIEVTGTPNLTISSALAGEEPSAVTDSSSTCAITTNGTNKRITASINTDMPAYVTLKVNVAAPSGSGTSLGYVPLSSSASDVVTGISPVAAGGLTIIYKLSAAVQAGVLFTDTRTVTFTLSD